MENQQHIYEEPIVRIVNIFKDAGEKWTDFLMLNVKAFTVVNDEADVPFLYPQLVEKA